MSGVLISEQALQIYLDLHKRCMAAYGESALVANHMASEIQRAVLAISRDPDASWLQRYRVPGLTGTQFVVVIPSPTGFDHDAAVIWMFRARDRRPAILAIQVEYLR